MKIMIQPDSKAYVEQITARRTGVSYDMRRQKAWAMLANGERRQVVLQVPRAKPEGWPAGEYVVGPGSFIVGKFAGIALGDIELIPVPAGK